MARKGTSTNRLFYENQYQREFTGRVLELREARPGIVGVVLDRTCFYPTSGGQPCDRGWLSDAEVLEVTDDDGFVVHWVRGKPKGTEVVGKIDWARRFDHMQQHSGQHILSQAFLQVLCAETVSFHLGETIVTIDLNLPNIVREQLEAVEDLANQIVFDDRMIAARFVSADELAGLTLRKAPSVADDVRIVQVEGFDVSPCGGTHCQRTGEVGLIGLCGAERRGNETRVAFHCGRRALCDYRWRVNALSEMGRSLSVHEREVDGAVDRLSEELASSARELRRLRDEALTYKVHALMAAARQGPNGRIVLHVSDGDDASELRGMASSLVKSPGLVALLATAGASANLVFARSSDLDVNMAALLTAVCERYGGRGGGQPGFAQGGGFPGSQAVCALDTAYAMLTEQGRDSHA